MRNDIKKTKFNNVAKLALALLAALALPLTMPLSAQAQYGWNAIPCDANGNPPAHPLYDSNGGYWMTDGQDSGTATNTFPADMTHAALTDTAVYDYLMAAYTPNTTVTSTPNYDNLGDNFLYLPGHPPVSTYLNWISFHTYASELYANNCVEHLYGDSVVGNYLIDPTTSHPELPSSSGSINGSVQAQVTGQLRAYFKVVYLDDGSQITPPAGSVRPDHVLFQLKSQVLAGAWHDAGASASASATDSFGESVSVSTASPLASNAPALTGGGVHIVSAHVGTNGVAEVYLDGSIAASADNEVSFAQQGKVVATTQALVSGVVNPLFAAALLQGYSTACAPRLCNGHPDPAKGWTPSTPRYFSGTGCEVDGTAVPASGYVTHAQLCVADTVVKEYWDTGATGCPNPLPTDGSVMTGSQQPNNTLPSPTLKALFDSTHFLDSTMIVLKLKVWDSQGGYYEAKIQGPAYNKGLALLNNTAATSEDTFGVVCVRSAMQIMNHTEVNPSVRTSG